MKVLKVASVSAGLLFVLLAALAWVLWRRPPPIPTLAFIGYTNKPHTIVVAQVLFRNESRVALEILPQIRDENVMQTNGEFFHVRGFHSPFPGGLRRVVGPAGTAVLDVHLHGDFREPWWTEVCTRPKLEPSKLRDWAAKIKQPTMRQWTQRLFPPAKDSYTKLGPFTNLPPGWVRKKDGSATRGRRMPQAQPKGSE